MKDLYLLDGYNIIFGMPDVFPKHELEYARQKLMDRMQDYGAHNDVEIIIVFDGQGTSDKVQVESISKNCIVVYTPSRMTADSYIEKESYRRREEYRVVYVVTSDGPEQNQILGHGSYRMAISDFARILAEDKVRQDLFIKQNHRAHSRSEVAQTLPPHVQEKLDALRNRKQ